MCFVFKIYSAVVCDFTDFIMCIPATRWHISYFCHAWHQRQYAYVLHLHFPVNGHTASNTTNCSQHALSAVYFITKNIGLLLTSLRIQILSRQMITCYSMKELGLVPFLCCCCFFIGILLKSISFLLCVQWDPINLLFIYLFLYYYHFNIKIVKAMK